MISDLLHKGHMIIRWDKSKSYQIVIDVKKRVGSVSPVLAEFSEHKYYDVNKMLTTIALPATIYNITKLYTVLKNRDACFTYAFLQNACTYIHVHKEFLAKKELIDSFECETIDPVFEKTGIPSSYIKDGNVITLFSHEKVGIMQLLTLPTFALLWEPGTCKTATVAITIKHKIDNGVIDNAIVFCPSKIKQQWVDEISTFAPGLNPVKLNSRNMDMLSSNKYNVFIATYENMAIHKKKYFSFLSNRTYLILDESTKIKNWTKRTRAALKLSVLTQHKTIMTGTICSEKLQDVFYQMKFMDGGERLGVTKKGFERRYLRQVSDFRFASRDNSLEEVSNAIFDISSRFRRDDVIDIPPCTRRSIFIDMTEDQRSLYDQVKSSTVVEVNDCAINAPIKIVEILRCRQITSGFVGTETTVSVPNPYELELINSSKKVLELDNPKLDMLEVLLEEDAPRTIVWVNWTYEREVICKLAEKLGVSYAYADGSVNEDKSDAVCKSFMKGTISLLILNVASFQYGKNLQEGGRVIYFSNSYSSIFRKQSEDRVFRPGQKHKVEIIDLLCNKSIDISIFKTLKDKKELSKIINRDNIEAILDGEI
jgi:SNF2 family DNA or RNA helicase